MRILFGKLLEVLVGRNIISRGRMVLSWPLNQDQKGSICKVEHNFARNIKLPHFLDLYSLTKCLVSRLMSKSFLNVKEVSFTICPPMQKHRVAHDIRFDRGPKFVRGCSE